MCIDIKMYMYVSRDRCVVCLIYVQYIHAASDHAPVKWEVNCVVSVLWTMVQSRTYM